MTLPTTDVDPLAGGVTTAMLVTTPLICALRLNANGVLNVTEPALFAAVGAAGAVTATVTVAGDDVPPAPVAVNVKLSLPMKPAFGA